MSDAPALISVPALRAAIEAPDVRIVDCRFDLLEPAAGRQRYIAGHIPGAVYADLDRDLAGPLSQSTGRHPLPDVGALAGFFGSIGIDADSRVLVYDDRSGAIAARAWWLLRWLGHESVALLDGGIAAWSAAGLALESGAVSRRAVRFDARPQSGWVLDTAQIEAQLPHALKLVDARAAARFEGRQEPIDTVAGHIPGAISLPFDRSLRPDGRFKTAAELSRMWAEVLPAGSAVPWAVMCGSGVTACHLALSAELAGLPRPGLYAGSWSEWIRDPRRPVATGSN